MKDLKNVIRCEHKFCKRNCARKCWTTPSRIVKFSEDWDWETCTFFLRGESFQELLDNLPISQQKKVLIQDF